MRTTKMEIGTSKTERDVLTDMCHCAKNLYNSALYRVRQKYHEEKIHLNENSIDKLMRENNPKLYYKLNSVAAQKVIKKLSQDYKSFFALNKKYKAGLLDFRPRPPKYKKDLGLISIPLNPRSFKIEDGKIRISVSKYHRNRFGFSFLEFDFGDYIDPASISEVEIVPFGFEKFELHVKYEEEKKEQVFGNGIMAIDMGRDIFAAITTSQGDAILVPGKQLKSINRQWNKTRAKLFSLLDQEKDFYKKLQLNEKIRNIDLRRNRTVNDVLHKFSKNIIKYTTEQRITTIVVGKNEGWKNGINIGRRNNQSFVNIPHARFIQYLTYKGEDVGIKVIEQEESYTSKCDSLALEEIRKHEKYSGRRTKRGLFKSATGYTIHADINGSLNIMRKCNGESEIIPKIAAIGRVFRPRKTRWGQLQQSPKPSSMAPGQARSFRAG